MDSPLFFPFGQSKSIICATQQLVQMGYDVADRITPEVTYLLADIPTKQLPADILHSLSENSIIIGGNLSSLHYSNHSRIDLLKDETFLCCNAAITAQCAIRIGFDALNSSYSGVKCMVIGCGRIGKHLVHLLKGLGADVTVVTRNAKDIALLRSFNISAESFQKMVEIAKNQDIVFNTVPIPVLQLSTESDYPKAIDLASSPGISGQNVIYARGLPGKMSPALTGKLIAQRIHSILSEEST